MPNRQCFDEIYLKYYRLIGQLLGCCLYSEVQVFLPILNFCFITRVKLINPQIRLKSSGLILFGIIYQGKISLEEIFMDSLLPFSIC